MEAVTNLGDPVIIFKCINYRQLWVLCLCICVQVREEIRGQCQKLVFSGSQRHH